MKRMAGSGRDAVTTVTAASTVPRFHSGAAVCRGPSEPALSCLPATPGKGKAAFH